MLKVDPRDAKDTFSIGYLSNNCNICLYFPTNHEITEKFVHKKKITK